MAMNYIRHLTGFFDKVTDDRDLNPTHISLYIALFQFWNCNRFRNPISISRDEIMRISKISSKDTYHKCLRELNNKAYIKYEPSYNPYKGSHVWLIDFADTLKPLGKSDKKSSDFGTVGKQVAGRLETPSQPATEQHQEQALVPSINNTNSTNISNKKNSSNLSGQAKNVIAKNEATLDKIVIPSAVKKNKEEKNSAKKEEKEMQNFNAAFANSEENQIKNSWQKKSGAKKKEKEIPPVTSSAVEKPKIEEVKAYFEQNSFPEIEAQKFFNYFASIGWLVGGKTPMVDWQASAQNWMINSVNFKDSSTNSPPVSPNRLNIATDKNYAEPL